MVRRDQSLDLIRAFAVSLVIFHHYFQLVEINDVPKIMKLSITFVVNYGAYGVQLFFVVSGYILITKYNQIPSFSKFILLRYTRLLPMLFIVIVLNNLFSLITNYKTTSPINSIPSIMILDPQILNIIFRTTEFHWVDNSFWSLFAEIRFYILFGFLLKFFNRMRINDKRLLLLSFFLSVKIVYVISDELSLESLHRLVFWLFIPDYCLYFLIGICLAPIGDFSKNYKLKFALFLTLIFVLENYQYVLNHGGELSSNLIVNIFYILFVYIIFFVARKVSNTLPNFANIPNLIGKPSYVSYLIHQNAFLFFINLSPQIYSNLFFIVLFYTFIILFSYLLSTFLEQKMIKSLRKIVISK